VHSTQHLSEKKMGGVYSLEWSDCCSYKPGDVIDDDFDESDWASCLSLDPGHLPLSKIEQEISFFTWEDLAKRRNYFDVESNADWKIHMDTTSPDGVLIKQYLQTGVMGHDEWMTVMVVPHCTSESYWGSKTDLAYVKQSSPDTSELDVLHESVISSGEKRQTHYTNVNIPYIAVNRNYCSHMDIHPRQHFADFGDRVCYSVSNIGLDRETTDEGRFTKTHGKTLNEFYSKWICWDEQDGMHIVSWFGEDAGWFSSIVRNMQLSIMPKNMDAAVRDAVNYDQNRLKIHVEKTVQVMNDAGFTVKFSTAKKLLPRNESAESRPALPEPDQEPQSASRSPLAPSARPNNAVSSAETVSRLTAHSDMFESGHSENTTGSV